MLVLTYEPSGGASETVCLVGKGIVYDTGGLSLKPKEGMSGMKHDMGGAAGMLGGVLRGGAPRLQAAGAPGAKAEKTPDPGPEDMH